MNEEEQDAMIRRLADQALQPPPVPREEIWARVVAARRLDGSATERPLGRATRRLGRRRMLWLVPLGIAALLALAFGLGRLSVKRESERLLGLLPFRRGGQRGVHGSGCRVSRSCRSLPY